MLDGVAVNSCLVLAGQADGCQIVTAAGLGSVKQPHPLHEAFADSGAIQCGYCTPGFIIAAKALLDRNPHPTEAEIREAISGNLCRCTGYGQIVEAVQIAAERLARRIASSRMATCRCICKLQFASFRHLPFALPGWRMIHVNSSLNPSPLTTSPS